MLLLVGWRGEPGQRGRAAARQAGQDHARSVRRDRHRARGAAGGPPTARRQRSRTRSRDMRATRAPYALVVRDGTFGGYKLRTTIEPRTSSNREGALRMVLDAIGPRCDRGRHDRQDVARALRAAAGGRPDARPRLSDRRLHGPRVADCPRHRARAPGSAGLLPRRRRRRDHAHGRAGDHRQPQAAQLQARRLQQRRARFGRRTADRGLRDRHPGRSRRACGYRAAWSSATAADIVARSSDSSRPRGPALLEIRVNKGARANLGPPDDLSVGEQAGADVGVARARRRGRGQVGRVSQAVVFGFGAAGSFAACSMAGRRAVCSWSPEATRSHRPARRR